MNQPINPYDPDAAPSNAADQPKGNDNRYRLSQYKARLVINAVALAVLLAFLFAADSAATFTITLVCTVVVVLAAMINGYSYLTTRGAITRDDSVSEK